MKSISNLRKGICLDLHNGLFKNNFLIVSPLLLGTVFFLDYWHRVQILILANQLKLEQTSIGDCWMYIYGGMRVYIPQENDKFHFPVTWMILFMLGTFLVLNYPFKDLESSGQQVLVRMGGYREWWLSKCVWNIVSVFYYHGMVILTSLGLCVIKGIPVSRKINITLLCRLFDIVDPACFWDSEDSGRFGLGWVMLPICMAAAITLFQMMLSLFLKPILAFLISTVLFITSAYLFLPFVPGNYAVALRGEWLLVDGMKLINGYIMVIFMAVSAVTIGFIKFKKYYDILGIGNN